MKVTCACLNVSVETELESLAQLDQASLDPPGHCVPLRSVLPLSIEHPPLSDVALGPDGWARITCLGCGLAVVAFHPSDPSAPPRMWLNPLPAADNSAIVAPAALHGDAIEAAKKSPGYSPAFRIVLDPSRPAPAGSPTISAAALAAVAVDDPAVPDSGSAPVHAPHEADLDAMAAKYMAVKRAEAEERIAAFRDSVNAELAEIQQRMASDRELLLSQYAAALQRAGVSESASVPEAAEASSQADPADPAAAVAAASGSHLSPSKPFLQASHARRSRSPPRPTPVPGADAATVFTAEVLSVSRPASSALSERLSRSSTPRASDASKDAAGGTLRNGTVLDPTAPAGTEHAAAAPSTSVAGSVRQVHFADDSAGPAVRLSRTDVAGPALQPDSHVAESGHGDGDGDDDDELFDMDDMSKRRVTKYALAAETKEDTSDQDDRGAIAPLARQPPSLLSMSLPIQIPAQFRVRHPALAAVAEAKVAQPPAAAVVSSSGASKSFVLDSAAAATAAAGMAAAQIELDMNGDDAEEPVFEPPHVFLARTYAGDGFLSSRPVNRKPSVI